MQSVIDFILAHQVVLAAMVVAILDFVFALNSSWQSNGILHSIYVFFQNLAKPKAS